MKPGEPAVKTGTGYRCSGAGRWLPRVLAGSVLVAAVLAGFRLDPRDRIVGSLHARLFVVLLGALFALWLVKKGAELRVRVTVCGEALAFVHGRRQAELRFREIASLAYEMPFGASRHWLPALILVDRTGKSWRLSALLRDGDRLVEEFLLRAERSDLAAWADALHLGPRMGRASVWTAAGYLLALLMLAAPVALFLR